MPYTQTTFLAARNRLAQDLGDPGKVFFTDEELKRYIIESLRWWGLESMYFRETARVATIAGQAFYDVPTVLKDVTNTTFLQGFSVTDRELINDINLALMEPQIVTWAGGWVGTEMFSLGEVTSKLQNGRDEFLRLSGCILQELPFAAGPSDNRVQLTEPFIRIVRASLKEASVVGPLPIWPLDQIQIQTTVSSAIAPAAGPPRGFSVSYSPQLTVDLWPKPQEPSTLNLYSVRTGATFNPTATATLVGVPEDASWILKYRALVDIFSGDGLSRAPQMVQYCEQRYADGLEALGLYQSLLWADLGGRKSPLTSVAQLDQYKPRWQQATQAQPVTAAQLNWNLFALSPIPDAIYILAFETVRKAPVPVADSDLIQVGTEAIDAIYDYAYHIALIKSQGREFMNSMGRYQSARELAAEYRKQVSSQSYLYRESQLPAIQDRVSRPLRRSSGVDAASTDRQLVET